MTLGEESQVAAVAGRKAGKISVLCKGYGEEGLSGSGQLS